MALFETLTDDFATLDTAKWPTRTTGVSVTGGVMQITVPANQSQYYLAQSAATHTIANSYVLARVTTAAPSGPSNSAQTYFTVDVDDNNWTGLVRDGNNLLRYTRTAGSDASTVIATYNATTMAWWRVRHNGTGFIYGYSADGISWTETAPFTPSWSVTTTMRATLMVGKWNADTGAATGTYDNFNLAPSAGQSITPDSVTVPIAVGEPTATFTYAETIAPDSVTAPITIGAPDLTFAAHPATPDSVTVPIAIGEPTVTFTAGQTIVPDSVTIGVTLGAAPTIGFMAAGTYGQGNYGDGPYGEAPPEQPALIDPVPFMADLMPRTAPVNTAAVPATHLLGIGPWNPGVPWRGAPNYGITASTQHKSVPVLPIPPATSQSFTLRVDGGGEARVDFQQPRDQAIIIEKFTTDLWWRRKDPSAGLLEVMGRFNADQVDISTSADGHLQISATFVDYQQLLSERLILRYLVPDGDGGTTAWAKGTTAASIATWIVPTDMSVDVSAVATASLGVTKEPFEIALGTSVEEAMRSLQAISSVQWEWWVDLPATSGARPKLHVAPGRRGRDLTLTLTDPGPGGPIATWTLQDGGSNYANNLYMIGGTGGVIVRNDDQYARFMPRDASETDSTLGGNKTAIVLAAHTRLAQMLDQRPGISVVLAPGFWRGRAHIDVGDRLNVRIDLGADTIQGNYRVTELSVETDSANGETVTLTLGTPAPAKDPRSRRSALSRLVRTLKNYERMEH